MTILTNCNFDKVSIHIFRDSCKSYRIQYKLELSKRINDIKTLVNDWNEEPTFFEITTALALEYFVDEKVDAAVLEVGLGGRLDSTNIVKPKVCVITPISLDHQHILGESMSEIATEKAGIIKSGVPVISSHQHEEARLVLETKSNEVEAPIEFMPASFSSPLSW